MFSLRQSPRIVSLITVAVMTVVLFPTSAAAAGSFSDVPEKSSEFFAVEFLKAKGIMQGYPDGTFKDRKSVV